MMRTTTERFWSKVDKSAPDGCWRWTAGIGTDGYGKFWANKKNHRAHRWAYTILVGPIPDGLQLDHLCHTNDDSCTLLEDCPHRRCVNPAHLEAVTLQENLSRSQAPAAKNMRKTHCVRGHPFDATNTMRGSGGCRRCRRCHRDRQRRERAVVRELVRQFRSMTPGAVVSA